MSQMTIGEGKWRRWRRRCHWLKGLFAANRVIGYQFTVVSLTQNDAGQGFLWCLVAGFGNVYPLLVHQSTI
ncbi:MAG: hypothetical protein K8L97_22225 [Anaerolineae bacterium]|nr:hypothetical protein [Anaerolineae bacterium]